MKSPTLHDVADVAGVSYATADRVVNRRGNVAAKSVAKVQTAVETLGYVRNVAAANLSRSRRYRFLFLVPRGPNAFFQRMRDHLQDMQDHLSRDQTRVELHEIAAFDAGTLAHALTSDDAINSDGIAVVGLSSDCLAAPLAALQAKGVPVVSLVSDLPQGSRAAYVGIDNRAAGRTAARLIGLAHAGRRGRIRVVAGSLNAQDHQDRFDGLADVISNDFPNLVLDAPELSGDDAETVARIIRRTTATAIYNLGAGNTGLLDALRGAPKPDLRICLVHELTEATRTGLLDGTINVVLDQAPEDEVSRALTTLRHLADDRPLPPTPPLVPTIYVADNLPPDSKDT